jgi:lysophospholipase L1-like esterase
VKPLRRLAQGALLVLATLAALACLEGVLAWGLRHPTAAPSPLVGALRQVHRAVDWPFPQLDPACAQWDPELTYTLRPPGCTVHDREFTVRYDVNSAGLRDDEAALHRPEIIVIGDSYAMGWGLPKAQAFPALVGTDLDRHVLAAGIPSYGTARELALLQRLDRASLRALVVQYCWNDVEENRAWRANGGRLPITSREGWESLVRTHADELRYWPGKYLAALVSVIAARVHPKAAHAASSPDVRDATDDLLALLEHYEAMIGSVPIVVVPLCERERDMAAEIAARAAAATSGTAAARVSSVEIATALEPQHFFPLDGHLNAAGHRLLADRVAAELVRRGVSSSAP